MAGRDIPATDRAALEAEARRRNPTVATAIPQIETLTVAGDDAGWILDWGTGSLLLAPDTATRMARHILGVPEGAEIRVAPAAPPAALGTPSPTGLAAAAVAKAHGEGG